MSDFFERELNLQNALDPAYTMLSPNVEIPLFRGKLKLSKYEAKWEGEGTIQVEWNPSPSICFKLDCEDRSNIPYSRVPIGPARLESAEKKTSI